jgi:hypothetical protein
MKFNSLPLLGMLMGLGFATASFIRYYALYPDLDRVIVDCIIGGLIFAVSWVYNSHINLSKELEKTQDTLDSVELNIKERLE